MKDVAPLVASHKTDIVTISLTYSTSQDTLISKVTGYVLDDLMEAEFYSLQLCSDQFWDPPSLLSNQCQRLLPWGTLAGA
jgi:hypothetical protein